MSDVLLNVENLCVRYDRLSVINGLSFHIDRGEIVALIGSNGAGKSSIINGICGVLNEVSGLVEFDGKRIDTLSAFERVKCGIVQVPEGRMLFGSMTVTENLILGQGQNQRAKPEIQKDLEHVFEIFPRLRERKKQLARTLSGGEQQMVAIARGLMGRPRLLILDEPSWGLAPKLVSEVFANVKRINAEGITVLLVEQHIQNCLRTSQRALVVENGKIVLEGTGAELLKDEHVKRAYLGM